MTGINMDVKQIGIIFTCSGKPNLGYLEWNEMTTFMIRDRNFNEVDIFHIFGVDTIEQAKQEAIDHFQAVIDSGEQIG